jgi:hypothetical protein
MLHIDVDHYDSSHAAILGQAPFGRQLQSLVNSGFDVPRDEFMAYMLFREQRRALPGWSTYRDMKRRLASRYTHIVENLDFTHGTVRSMFSGQNQTDTAIVDGCGIAGGLTLVNRLFGLHEADWQQIPVSDRPDLDYELASTGSGYVEIECKGRVVNTTGLAPLSSAKADIENKKREQRQNQGNAHVLLGVITAVPYGLNTNTCCRVLDPEPEAIEAGPARHRLLARLYFYLNNLRMLSDSQLMVALRNRLEVLKVARDYKQFDGMKFRKTSGEPFNIHANSFSTQTVIPQLSVVGRVVPIDAERFLFCGFDIGVFNVIARQDFGTIVEYAYSPDRSRFREEQTVTGIVDYDDLYRLSGMPPGDYPQHHELRKARVQLHGRLCPMPSGRVVGVLKPVVPLEQPAPLRLIL